MLDSWTKIVNRTAEQLAIKVGGLKKVWQLVPAWACQIQTELSIRIFFKPPTLRVGGPAALWLTETQSTSLEKFKPLLMTYSMFKILEALLRYFTSVQNYLNSILETVKENLTLAQKYAILKNLQFKSYHYETWLKCQAYE